MGNTAPFRLPGGNRFAAQAGQQVGDGQLGHGQPGFGVAEPMWGKATTLGSCSKGDSAGSGSTSNTSRPAP
jgi:hypothetical protein